MFLNYMLCDLCPSRSRISCILSWHPLMFQFVLLKFDFDVTKAGQFNVSPTISGPVGSSEICTPEVLLSPSEKKIESMCYVYI